MNLRRTIKGNCNIDMIKVLSIIEPWATLIKEKKKYIETRTWKTSYRGELYIHASKKKININAN